MGSGPDASVGSGDVDSDIEDDLAPTAVGGIDKQNTLRNITDEFGDHSSNIGDSGNEGHIPAESDPNGQDSGHESSGAEGTVPVQVSGPESEPGPNSEQESSGSGKPMPVQVSGPKSGTNSENESSGTEKPEPSQDSGSTTDGGDEDYIEDPFADYDGTTSSVGIATEKVDTSTEFTYDGK